MESIDYAEVGLIAGLEVHQQLLTERKMFCHCPARRYTTNHDGEVLRHMRPTLSELGEYDGTALMEFKTRKNIIYLLHEENVCTYEMDDTPPFLVNQDAVDVAIEQCLMLGCDIVDEVHIARKQYLDGSIPTGFQRTAIVGVSGRLPFRGRELSILQVSVEEDSCREVSDKGHLIVWRTDRLGMPLIETVTGPDLRTPEEVAEAILLVGRVCRSTGHVRVGIGASRQDVNVSVRGGRRVEIKGVPKAGWAPALVHGEAVRQVNLLKLRDELHRRGFTSASSIAIDSADVTSLFASSEMAFLRRDGWERFVADEGRRPGFELGNGAFTVRAVRLKGLTGTLSWPTQPDLSFAHELAGRVRVIAGAGASATDKAIELVRHAKAVGADAALVVTPYYNRPSQEGLYLHYKAINDAVQLPILVYNVPTRTSVDISNDILERLAKLPNIVGIKDATSDLVRASFQRLRCGEDWVMLSGDDPTALGYMAHGGHGCISVTCNVAPDLCAQFYNDVMAGDWQAALQLQDRLVRLHKALFADASPAPTKFALEHLGLCSAETRLPIAPAAEAARAEVLAAMRDAGVI
ncbi:MAG TPA: 4-hydroxy-tetrahydrodipicolinate synthase [Vicinamibacterales bacterium]|nr:4-hydroxy-tetrahydrodipicolinate synthase [Vicinamibacterales bacterium]